MKLETAQTNMTAMVRELIDLVETGGAKDDTVSVKPVFNASTNNRFQISGQTVNIFFL